MNKSNENVITYNENFFEIKFNDNLDPEFGNILRNNPYTEQNKIDELLSHLVTIDEIKKHKNIAEKNLVTKNIDFSISYAENGKKITENLSIPFGMGHFAKGIEHLKEIGRVEYDTPQKDSLSFLKEKFQALTKPPKIPIESLEKNGWNTLDKCAKILDTFSSPELSHFIQGFLETGKKDTERLNDIIKNKSKESNQNKAQGIKVPEKQEQDNQNHATKQNKITEMKTKVKQLLSQKKSNIAKAQEKEITNHKNLGIAR